MFSYQEPTGEKKDTNPLAWGGGILLSLFVLFTVVAPLMQHYFPSYWERVHSQPSDTDEP